MAANNPLAKFANPFERPLVAPQSFRQRPAPQPTDEVRFQQHEVEAGRLTEVIEVEPRTGRRISRFYGVGTWDCFKAPVRCIAHFNIPAEKS